MDEKKEVVNILIVDIIPNRFQPRLSFDDKELNDLAASIKQHGIIQPLVLRKISDKYEIIAGERRYKAAIIVGLSSVPAIIVEADDNKSAELAIVENVQRKDLNAMEEAQSYKKLMDKGFTQDEIAKKIGVTQSTVANKIRLLSLDEEVQDALLNSKISERHARSLLSISDPATQIKILNKIIVDKLTVKQAEDEIAKILGKTKPKVDDIVNIASDKMNINDLLKPEAPKNYDYPTANDFSINPFQELKTDIPESIKYEEKIETPISNEVKETPENYDSEVLNFDDIEEIKLDNPVSSYSQEAQMSTSPLIEEFKQQKAIDDVVVNEEDTGLNISTAINSSRDLSKELEEKGFRVETEEFDFEDMYQIIFKIYKN